LGLQLTDAELQTIETLDAIESCGKMARRSWAEQSARRCGDLSASSRL
jgi:hypothetical protein